MKVAVIGAGLQGACTALELSSHGISVDLYDRNDAALSEASSHNEGKIHLGYNYAKDTTLNTARLMARAALAFAPLLRRWTGGTSDLLRTSQAFCLALHRDSLVTADEMEAYLRACAACTQQAASSGPADYFGRDYTAPVQRLEGVADTFDSDFVTAVFRVPEVALDVTALADVVRAALSREPDIHLRLNAEVTEVDVSGQTPCVRGRCDGSAWSEPYDHVVNAAWDGRLAIDATAGAKPKMPWLFRMKYYLRLPAHDSMAGLPPTNFVLGPFGDMVRYADGSAYLCWYPDCVRLMSSLVTPPRWPRRLEPDSEASLRVSVFEHLQQLVPSLSRLPDEILLGGEIHGGVIFAAGSTDIADPASGLHQRTAIGPVSYGRYHTVDTGKLTTAPLFATVISDRIRGI
jgi:glycine/D-amino acid oxidase-like deaminating enzyme